MCKKIQFLMLLGLISCAENEVIHLDTQNKIASPDTQKVQKSMAAFTGASDPDQFRGLRTKWLVIDDQRTQNGRNSVEPNLAAQSVAQWVSRIEVTGANILEINLENSTAIKSTQVHTLATLRAWRDGSGSDNLKYFTACGKDEVTPSQWRELLCDFLIKVKATGTQLKFSVHQRIYPDYIGGPKYNVFVNDMSDFINLAKAKGVDSLLTGPRLGENGFYNNMNFLLEFSYNACKDINAKTANWVKTKNYMTNGGGRFGASFKGINEAATRFQTKYGKSFFKAMEEQTGSFAFGYKHFEDGGINTAMTSAGYNKNLSTDWGKYIEGNLDFSGVKQLIWENRLAFPKHANMMFFGDSGDSFKLVGTPAYTALLGIFGNANKPNAGDTGGGFNGILCVEAFTASFNDDPDEDNFKQVYFVNVEAPNTFISISTKQKSLDRWKKWPISLVL